MFGKSRNLLTGLPLSPSSLMAWSQMIWSTAFPAWFVVILIPQVQSWFQQWIICDLENVSPHRYMIHCWNQLWTQGMRITTNLARHAADQITCDQAIRLDGESKSRVSEFLDLSNMNSPNILLYNPASASIYWMYNAVCCTYVLGAF